MDNDGCRLDADAGRLVLLHPLTRLMCLSLGGLPVRTADQIKEGEDPWVAGWPQALRRLQAAVVPCRLDVEGLAPL